jgi:hypothetical protein
LNLRVESMDGLFVALLHQAIAPVVVTFLAVEDGLNYDLLPAICIQRPPELLLLALIAAFGTIGDVVF